MEQNLSERERRIRLVLGLVFVVLAGASYFRTSNIYFLIGFGLAGLGFVMNYFTCFCGTKKMIKGLRHKIAGE